MNILVTGATGFLGTNLCRRLEAQGHTLKQLNSKNCNLTVDQALNRFNDTSYDLIYHLAAWTKAGDFCLYHPGEQWIINQQINTNVLKWWQDVQPQSKLICIGTSCAYAPDQQLIEENYLSGLPIESLFTYAMTKRMLYVGLLALQKQYGLKYLYLVPSTLYGQGYHTDARQMHFIFDIIRKIVRGKIYGDPVILWGDGYQRRELIFIDNFVEILTKLSHICDNEIVNIGVGEEFTIRHFADLVCEIVGYDSNDIQFDETRYVGTMSKCLSIQKLREIIPDLELTSLSVGLAKTVDWFLKSEAYLS